LTTEAVTNCSIWATERGVTTFPAEHALRETDALSRAHALAFASDADAGFVSLCLDAIALSHAPGVSAPSALGLSPLHALELARRAGGDPRVLHFDVMELSPPHDVAGATAALAALRPFAPHLAAIGLSGFGSESKLLAQRLTELGASRICALGRMQAPPLGWHHDNRGVFEPIARFADLEPLD